MDLLLGGRSGQILSLAWICLVLLGCGLQWSTRRGVTVLVRWAKGKRSTNLLPNLSLTTLSQQRWAGRCLGCLSAERSDRPWGVTLNLYVKTSVLPGEGGAGATLRVLEKRTFAYSGWISCERIWVARKIEGRVGVESTTPVISTTEIANENRVCYPWRKKEKTAPPPPPPPPPSLLTMAVKIRNKPVGWWFRTKLK